MSKNAIKILSIGTASQRIGAMFATLALTCIADAHWAQPKDVPVTRLVENLSEMVKAHPNDADAWYALGRTHSLAFTLKQRTLSAWERGVRLEPAEKWMQQDWDHTKKADPPSEAELQTHLVEGVQAIKQAISLRPERAEQYLSLASLLEAGLPSADKVHVALPTCYDVIGDRGVSATAGWEKKAKEPETRHWQESIADYYFAAFAAFLPKDSKIVEQPLRGAESLVSYEAAKCYVDFIKSMGERDQDAVRVKVANAAIKAWKTVPPTMTITPIVFSFESDRALNTLLDPDIHVSFDLDGTGRPQTWSWVKPDTGILVWDPEHTGKITSGRQLFGSVSWWIFFRDGYQALAALDDNHDGELSGAELKGLAVWFDRNSNGISDPGEVIPVDQLNITSLATTSTGQDGASLVSKQGVRFADGRVLPTYDWVTSPLAAKTDPVSAK